MADSINIETPGLPTYEHVSTSGTETAKPSLSKEQVLEQGRSSNLADEEVDARLAKVPMETEQAQAHADAAAKELQLQDQLVKQKQAADAAALEDIARKTEVLRMANEEIKKQPTPSLFADRQGWSKAKLAIGLALGGFGDAMLARASAKLGHDLRGTAVNDIINADLERQRENIHRLTDNAVMAKEGVKSAQDARTMALARIDAVGADMFKRAGLYAASVLAAKGVQGPALQAQIDALGIKRNEQDRQTAAVAPLTQQHSTRSGDSTTNRDPATGGGIKKEFQARDAIMGQGLQDDVKVLSEGKPVPKAIMEQYQDNRRVSESLEAKEGPVGAMIATGARALGAPRTALDGIPKEYHNALNAYDSVVTTLTHQMTGAGMSEKEAFKKATLLGPQPGDSPELQAEKIARISAIAAQLKGVAGPEATAIVEQNARVRPHATPTPNAQNPIKQQPQGRPFTTPQGKRGVLMPDGTVKML